MSTDATQIDKCRVEGVVVSDASWDTFPANGADMRRVEFDLKYLAASSMSESAPDEWCARIFHSKKDMKSIRVRINNPEKGYMVPTIGTCAVFEWTLVETEINFSGFGQMEEQCSTQIQK